jgi:uncharacterized membrane protein YidH (DUF202 family)
VGRDVRRQPRDKPGLQAERTGLAWERTAVGFLASGAIPLFKQSGPLAVGGDFLVGAAVLLASLAIWLGRRRGQRTGAMRPAAGNHVMSDARTEVLLLGWAVVGFAMAIVVLVLLSR